MQQALSDRRKKQAGFTLIELMIVIAVIGIIALFGVPKYYAVKDQYKLESAAQKVASQLHYAKQLSMDQRVKAYVVFQQDNVRVYRENPVGSLEIMSPPMYYEGGVTFLATSNTWMPLIYMNITSGTLLGRGLHFTFRGFPSHAGDIVLQTAGGRTTRITITEATGQIILK